MSALTNTGNTGWIAGGGRGEEQGVGVRKETDQFWKWLGI